MSGSSETAERHGVTEPHAHGAVRSVEVDRRVVHLALGRNHALSPTTSLAAGHICRGASRARARPTASSPSSAQDAPTRRVLSRGRARRRPDPETARTLLLVTPTDVQDVARGRRRRGVATQRFVQNAFRTQPSVQRHGHARQTNALELAVESAEQMALEVAAIGCTEEADTMRRGAVHAQNRDASYVVRGRQQSPVPTHGDHQRRVGRLECGVRALQDQGLCADAIQDALDLVDSCASARGATRARWPRSGRASSANFGHADRPLPRRSDETPCAWPPR